MGNIRRGIVVGFLLALAFAGVAHVTSPARAQESPAQVQLQQKFVYSGVGAQGAGVLQVGEVNTLSAAVATATLTQVVAAPAAGLQTYLRGLLVQKAATASSGSTVTVEYGTGTNCGTGTTVLLGPLAPPPVGYIPLNILVPAANAVCLATDASTTSVRVLAQ